MTSTMPPRALQELTLRFNRDKERYIATDYLEAHVREEFLNPLFELLGWDVRNQAGAAPTRREVIPETREGTSLVDYTFRQGGKTEFLVEAKRPAVDIEHERDPAYQARDYGFRAKVPLAILTNFDRFVVYDCRTEPRRGDAAHVGRVLVIPYHEYLTRWHEITEVFSREAVVVRGSLDTYFTKTTRSRTVVELPSLTSPGAAEASRPSSAPLFPPSSPAISSASSGTTPPTSTPSPPRKEPLANRSARKKMAIGIAVLTFVCGMLWAVLSGISDRSDSAAPPDATGCRYLTRTEVHLRPRPTRRTMGPAYPAGTEMQMEAPAGPTRSGSTLYRVRVQGDGQVGFVFVTPSEMAARFACPAR